MDTFPEQTSAQGRNKLLHRKTSFGPRPKVVGFSVSVARDGFGFRSNALSSSLIHVITWSVPSIELVLDLANYRMTAIKKAAYKLAERCTVVLKPQVDQTIPVTLELKPNATAEHTVRAFYEELLDQELREQVAEETAPIRSLILAHAFSKVDLIKRD